MRLKFRNFPAAVSLVFCVATVALWVRSYIASDVLTYDASTWGFDLRSGIGKVQFTLSTDRGGMQNPFRWLHDTYTEQRRRAWSHGKGIWGFDLEKIVQLGITYRLVKVPHWFLAALFSIAPTVWLVNRRRVNIRIQRGLCPRCGYDLRATPGRCPECGAVREARAEAAA